MRLLRLLIPDLPRSSGGDLRRRKIRGIATMLAVFLVGSVGLAVGLLAAMFADDARRTQQQLCEAQLREILHAAPSAAMAVVSTDPLATPVAVPLPPACRDASLSLKVTEVSPDRRNVQALAVFQRFHASETLEFQRQGSTWKLQSATLTPNTDHLHTTSPQP